MTDKENRSGNEYTPSGRDGNRMYKKEEYFRNNRFEGNDGYRRRSYDNRGGDEGQRAGRSSYNSRNSNYNNEDRPQRNWGNRPQQRYYGNDSSYGNQENGERNPYASRFNREGRPQRPSYNSRYGANEQGEQRPYRPRFNGEQGGRNNGYRPQGGSYSHYNEGRSNGYAGRSQQGNYRQRTKDYNPNAKYSMKKQIEYKDVLTDPNEPIRLNKFLANAGICSRREADEYITAGVVSVNGQVVTELGTKVKRTDEIKFHDQPVSIERKVYVLLNKPKDCVTTSDDPQSRKTVMDLVKDACQERIYPVGRLDRNTTGVLLLTNDGDLASKLTHPKFLKKKIYHVYCDRNVTEGDLDRIVSGITLDDGEIHADAVSYASDTDKSQVGIEIHSGKNRIVRRIFEALGYRVVKLDRVYFAGLTKKGLRRGDWRFLTEKEVNMLRMGSFE